MTAELANLVPAWKEGIPLMKVGAKYKFFVPSHLAYGVRGSGPVIGPNETLIFEVELLNTKSSGLLSKPPVE